MKTFSTITKAELVEALEELNDNDLVAFASDYGDHGHTQQVHRIRGNVEEAVLMESAYSDSGWAVANEEEWDSDPGSDEPKVEVYIIK